MALPLTEEEQTLLLESLGQLVEAVGPAPLLAAPIEPTPAFFPDRYVPTADGARAVAERLLGYAGLGSLHCVVEVAEPRAIGLPDAAAWFTGIEGFRCFFGVAPAHLGDAEALVASLAHEVAHAFRHHHRLVGRGALEEEESTDATTVYLGFGVMTTIMTERLRTSGHFDGSRAYTYSSRASLGYLPPSAMAFLLAAQAIARRAGWRERRHLAGLLETNQAASFRAARSALARREPELIRLLRLPSGRKGTPAPRALRPVTPVTDAAPPPAPAPEPTTPVDACSASPARAGPAPASRARCSRGCRSGSGRPWRTSTGRSCPARSPPRRWASAGGGVAPTAAPTGSARPSCRRR